MKSHIGNWIIALSVLISGDCWAQPTSTVVQFVYQNSHKPVSDLGVLTFVGDSIKVFNLDSNGMIAISPIEGQEVIYELTWAGTMIKHGSILPLANTDTLIIEVSAEIALEEVCICKTREPYDSHGCGIQFTQCTYQTRGCTSLFSGMGGLQMTDGSAATFFHLLKIER